MQLNGGTLTKKMHSLIIWCLVFLLLWGNSNASEGFDVSVFENDSLFEVEFDDLTDTGVISLAGAAGASIGTPEDDDGFVIGSIDIRVWADENDIAAILLVIYYAGEEWVHTEKIIFKPVDTRYTFPVGRLTDVTGKMITEIMIIPFSDESIGMIKEMVELKTSSVRCRLVGSKRDVNCDLVFNLEGITALYDKYVEAGGLSQPLSMLRQDFPVDIK